MFYIHKHEVSQHYGGSEEGGWWFDTGFPADDWGMVMIEDQEIAYQVCRALNAAEDERRKEEESYEYTSVLSYKSTHFSYSIEEYADAKPFPQERPHYE